MLDQGYVEELAGGLATDGNLTIICGRYGGVDERVGEHLATEAVSLGSFVLSGGEIVAAAISDAVIRLLDGVLGNAESLVGESFSEEDVLGPPQYTRPAEWDGEAVPGVLLSGDHARIRAWRGEQSRLRASQRKP
jgi:tRNA (guanine37-N1)-methyltransferase